MAIIKSNTSNEELKQITDIIRLGQSKWFVPKSKLEKRKRKRIMNKLLKRASELKW